MLVEEMKRKERQQRCSLLPELTFSELELLGRLDSRQSPRAAVVGRMSSVDAVHALATGDKQERSRLSRIASLREGTRRRPGRKRNLVTTVSDSAATPVSGRALHRPLLQSINGEPSHDAAAVSVVHTRASNSGQEMETVAL